MPHRHSAPTRTLPSHPSLAQLRKQAKELLKAFQGGQQEALLEVEQFEQSPNPTTFALADAQRVLARTYGFPSWVKLKQHVDGVNNEAFIAAAAAGDVVAVRKLALARPDLVRPDLAEFNDSALHRAVFNRDVQMTKVLMQLGADARQGIWPHRDATSAYTIAQDRQYDEIVAAIEHEEAYRRQALSAPGSSSGSLTSEVLAAIRNRETEESLRLLQGDLSLVGSCDVHGATPLHAGAETHAPQIVAWLLAHHAPVDARDVQGKTPLDYAALAAGWSANERFFPYLPNAQVEPARFHEVVQLLRSAGAQLTPRAAVACGDREAVTTMHRDGRLKNEIDFWRGGLLTIATRVNRIDMVSLLLDLGFDPDERAMPTEDGGESWGFPLWFAATCGRHDIAELLIAHGADVNAIYYASGSPLCYASDKKMEALLVEHGAQVTVEQITDHQTVQAILAGTVQARSLNVRDPSRTDLAEQMLWAAMRSDAEIVRMCLPHVTRRRDDPWWNYVLVNAALPETLRAVLEHGIDPDVVGPSGYTILHHLASQYVADEQRILAAIALLDAGASLTVRDSLLKSTPLGWACRWGRRELAELLLHRGADPREAGADPWATPMAWAAKGGHLEIVQMLRSAGAEN